MYVHYVRRTITLNTWNKSVFPWFASRITMSTINPISSQIMSLTKSYHNMRNQETTPSAFVFCFALCLADLIILSCVSAGNWMKTSDGLSFNTTVTDIHPKPKHCTSLNHQCTAVVVQPKSPLSLPWPVLLRPRCSSVLAGNHVPCAT